MRGAAVRDAPGLAMRGRLDVTGTKYRKPDDVSAQVRIGNFCQNTLFDFGGPPKTNASSRIDQKKQSHGPCISVERRANRLEVDGELGDG